MVDALRILSEEEALRGMFENVIKSKLKIRLAENAVKPTRGKPTVDWSFNKRSCLTGKRRLFLENEWILEEEDVYTVVPGL